MFQLFFSFYSKDTLEELWESAVKLAYDHQKERYIEVVNEVCQRLIDIQRFEAAADLYKDIELYREAVDCLVKAEVYYYLKEQYI